jgi:hypothetical protein
VFLFEVARKLLSDDDEQIVTVPIGYSCRTKVYLCVYRAAQLEVGYLRGS